MNATFKLIKVLEEVKATLNVLADSVLHEQPAVRRKKLEHLITELVHQRDTTRMLIKVICYVEHMRSLIV